MGRFALLLYAVAALAGPAGADAIDDFIEAELERQGVPGVALGIFRNGEALRLQGYGLADIEHDVPVRPETIFQTGSIGKMFTAAAVMVLVEEGLLDLDASVRLYLSRAPEAWQPITLRHLLNHTSGLGNADLDLQREYGGEDLLRAHFAAPVAFAPGQRWSYSNTGYELLGIIVDRVAGRPYGDVLGEHVFGPAGMRTARVISDRDIVMNRASGYEMEGGELKNQSWVAPVHNLSGAGSLYMSLFDYARWDAAVAGRRHLSPESWREMLQPARLNNGDLYPYGFGWNVEEGPDGQLVLSHSGGWQGFRTDLRRYDRDGITFVVLANGPADASSLLQGVAERHDPRYRVPSTQAIRDDMPRLSETLAQALVEIERGRATVTDFSGLDGSPWGADALNRSRDALRAAVSCEPPQLIGHQPNGDRLDRRYRIECSDASVVVDAVFATEGGRLLSAYAWQERRED